jgi:hypothetical protein
VVRDTYIRFQGEPLQPLRHGLLYEAGVEPTRLRSQLGLNEPRLPFQHTYTTACVRRERNRTSIRELSTPGPNR